MEFGIEKCVMQTIRIGKRQMTIGIESQIKKIQKVWRKENVQIHMGILERVDGGKITREYLRRPRKLLETKLCNRNLIKVINSRAVPLVRYSGLFLKWKRRN